MKKIVLICLYIYKKIISPIFVLLFGNSCRYTPTCSEYAYQAVKKYGVAKGMKLSFSRFMSCNYLSKKSSFDPIP